jgi:hypothetical protein
MVCDSNSFFYLKQQFMNALLVVFDNANSRVLLGVTVTVYVTFHEAFYYKLKVFSFTDCFSLF